METSDLPLLEFVGDAHEEVALGKGALWFD